MLSTFSFHKEAMYRDLRENFERIVGHPIVSALAAGPRRRGRRSTSRRSTEAALDDAFPPEQAVTILDADASQRQCVAAAREGRSFVMDGPPGTGKSQTIANMIAELITHGKTVLFVSEKAAALDVVHNRLAHVGLDEYVLELHSHKTTRAAVATALGRLAAAPPQARAVLTSFDLEDAARRRVALSTLRGGDERAAGRARRALAASPARADRGVAAPSPGAGGRRARWRWTAVRELGRAAAGHLGGGRARRGLRVARRDRHGLERRGRAARARGAGGARERAGRSARVRRGRVRGAPARPTAGGRGGTSAVAAARGARGAPGGHPAGLVRGSTPCGRGASGLESAGVAGGLRRRGGRGRPGLARARRAGRGRRGRTARRPRPAGPGRGEPAAFRNPQRSRRT